MTSTVGGGSHNALIASYPRIGQWLVVFAQDVALDVAARLLHFRMLADIGIAERVGYGFYFDETSLWRWISECGFKSCPRALIFICFYTVYYFVLFVEIELGGVCLSPCNRILHYDTIEDDCKRVYAVETDRACKPYDVPDT